MEGKRAWIDYAKAIGIVLVVYGHVARGLVTAKYNLDESIFSLVDNIIYSFHMPLFFFLSGVLLIESLARRGPSRFVLGKVDSIVYPYVVWSLIQGGIEVAMSRYTNGNVSVGDVLGFFWQPRAQFWFLYTLFFIFVLSAILYQKNGLRVEVVVLLGAFLIYFLRPFFDLPWIFKLIFIYFVFFALGVVFRRVSEWFSEKCIALSICFGGLAVFAQIYLQFYIKESYSSFDLLVFSVAALSIAFVVSFSMLLARLRLGFLEIVGAGSMAIYLMHIVAGSGARVVLGRLFGVTSVSMHLVVGTLLGVILPLVAVRMFGGRLGGMFLKPPFSLSALKGREIKVV